MMGVLSQENHQSCDGGTQRRGILPAQDNGLEPCYDSSARKPVLFNKEKYITLCNNIFCS